MKKKLSMPHTFIIIAVILLLGFLATFVLPSGAYDRELNEETNIEVVNPDSFHYLDKEYLGIADLFTAIPEGMAEAASIIFFIFIVCGAFQIVNATGATEVGIANLARAMKGKEVIGIPIFMIVCAIMGTTFGMSEETIIFAPIGIMLARALGYDAMTGCAMVVLGANAGFTSGCMNPFTVGVAQSIAELPTFSGIGMRVFFLVILTSIGCIYVMRYAMKVKADPEYSYVRELELDQNNSDSFDLETLPKLTKRQIAVLLVLVIAIAVMIYGIITKGWYLTEMGAIFIAVGLLSGIIGGVSPNKICEEFVEGAKTVTYGALLVGLTRAIIVVLENGQIIDTIVRGLGSVVQLLPDSISAIGMFFVQIIINFFINSGSGQAMVTMPIMAPLADIVGVTRQTAVAAFQFGDGFTNALFPTSAVLMAVMSVCKIPYSKYFKFALPLILIWSAAACIFLVICTATGYGPY